MKSRQSRKEEEKRIIAEMDEAIREVCGNVQSEPVEKEALDSVGTRPTSTSQKLYCRRCKGELRADGVCPVCGYRVYMPMDENKRRKIRWIVAGVCVVGFLILYCMMR